MKNGYNVHEKEHAEQDIWALCVMWGHASKRLKDDPALIENNRKELLKIWQGLDRILAR